ncbi:MAG TPA: hypothetical protein VK028_07555 [Micromonosporaceae bacterium]|nr:hypothetical protein [Micromonosporaceae bacterium]
MEDTLVRDALRAYVAGGPPMGLTSRDILAAGRRARRRHTVRAVVLGSGAAAGVFGIAALLLPAVVPAFAPVGGGRGGAPDPATCAAIREASAYEQQKQNYTVPETSEAAERVTCYLMATLPRYFPSGTRFLDDPNRPGTAALVASPVADPTRDVARVELVREDPPHGDLTRYVSASAIVDDGAGAGLLFFAVAWEKDFDWKVAEYRCGPGSGTQCHTGPHGEHIEVYESGPNQLGVRVRTMHVHSPNTLIIATSVNAPAVDGVAATRAEPPLTLTELIEITTDLDLRLYP